MWNGLKLLLCTCWTWLHYKLLLSQHCNKTWTCFSSYTIKRSLHLSSPASQSWTAVELVCWKSHLPWYWTSLSPALALWHFQRYSHLETRPPGSFLGKLGRKSCIQARMHCRLRASLWNFSIRGGRVRKHQIQISEGKNDTRYNIALQTLAYLQKCARETIERNGVLLTFHGTWDVYLRQNGRENCDEKGEPSCHAFRFSWAAASPTIIFPERAYSNVKGCNENKRRRVKGISRWASTLHGTSVCTSNFQVIQKVKVKLGNQHLVLFLFVSRYPRSMFSIPQWAHRCV